MSGKEKIAGILCVFRAFEYRRCCIALLFIAAFFIFLKVPHNSADDGGQTLGTQETEPEKLKAGV